MSGWKYVETYRNKDGNSQDLSKIEYMFLVIWNRNVKWSELWIFKLEHFQNSVIFSFCIPDVIYLLLIPLLSSFTWHHTWWCQWASYGPCPITYIPFRFSLPHPTFHCNIKHFISNLPSSDERLSTWNINSVSSSAVANWPAKYFQWFQISIPISIISSISISFDADSCLTAKI